MSIDIDVLSKQEFFTELDRRFASFIKRLSGVDNPELELASLLISNRTGIGDICLEIPAIAARSLFDAVGEGEGLSTLSGNEKWILPKYKQWIKRLRESVAVGRPNEFKPLILDDKGRLYLYRYWEYERLLAENITKRLSIIPDNIDLTLLGEGLERLFPHDSSEEIDWQRVAALVAVTRRFCVVSGGPGTGKTSTVIKIIALLLEQAQERGDSLAIALAAPTGKAAARLAESVKEARESLDFSNDVREDIPVESFTIHRLLGSIPGSPYFRHNNKNLLPYDIVIVDESSMADLALMSKLFQAVSLSAHLILLGDKDQLASVEAGAVLGDICDTGNEHGYSKDLKGMVKDVAGETISKNNEAADGSQIADSIVVLRRSYRFGSESGISVVGNLIKIGNADDAIRLLREGVFDDISLADDISSNPLSDALEGYIIKGYSPCLAAKSPYEAFDNFSRFTILCALRHGHYSVENVNRIVEIILNEKGLIKRGTRWYNGRPIMVTRNNYKLRLFNGDVGLILPDDSETENLTAFFPSSDGTLRKVHPLKLPEHETAYSMTVHKSQGSEFDHLLLLLPDRPSKVLTRELIYTAITRARKRVEIWGSEDVLRFAIDNPTTRKSGLRDKLWGTLQSSPEIQC